VTKHTSHPPPDSAASGTAALLTAFRDVLLPLTQLAVAKGVRYAELDEMLKSALIDAAQRAQADADQAPSVSRLSAATGINRREVTRLTQDSSPDRSKPRSAVNQVFARWLSDPVYNQRPDKRRVLPRLGDAPSFESLATSVNRDVRPRTLLDELCRLGLACVHEADDTVELIKDNFVPSSDEAQMLAFLGANVGDHLRAAVENVSATGLRHLEQAIFTDQLSARSIEEVRPQVKAQWKAVVELLAPAVQSLMDEDSAAQRPQDHRLRIGMYMYAAPGDPSDGDDVASTDDAST
jgi:Family of unknown function (DUF6502)